MERIGPNETEYTVLETDEPQDIEWLFLTRILGFLMVLLSGRIPSHFKQNFLRKSEQN